LLSQGGSRHGRRLIQFSRRGATPGDDRCRTILPPAGRASGYGFYLLYRQVLESIGDVRSLTENTFGLAD
jgi:hypothetical protein